jgi:Immunity protein 26
MKLPYSEGSVFHVPLRDGGAARGVVARASREGKILLGYFFGPRLAPSDAIRTDDLHPGQAILCVRFGDLGLINGEWTLHGKVPHWNRSEWPMPEFVRLDPTGNRKPMLVRYSDLSPLHIEAEYPIDDDRGLARNLLFGYGAIEIRLTTLLRGI